MNEDKAKICKILLPALQATRNLSDLVNLTYEELDSGEETVTATFENGYKKKAWVTADSGTSMIRDIISQIV